MGVFGFLKHKTAVEKLREEASEEEEKRIARDIVKTEKATRLSRLQFLQKRLKQLEDEQQEILLERQIEHLERSLYGDEEEEEDPPPAQGSNPEDVLLSGIFQKIFSSSREPPLTRTAGNGQPPTAESGAPRRFTIEQFKQFKNNLDGKTLKSARKLDDTSLSERIKYYIPDISDDQIPLAISVLREE